MIIEARWYQDFVFGYFGGCEDSEEFNLSSPLSRGRE